MSCYDLSVMINQYNLFKRKYVFKLGIFDGREKNHHPFATVMCNPFTTERFQDMQGLIFVIAQRFSFFPHGH